MSIFPRIAVPAAVGLIAALSLVGCSGNDADMDSESNVGAPASTPDTELPEDEVASEEDESVNDSGNEDNHVRRSRLLRARGTRSRASRTPWNE